jgi:hypothetical protein
MPITLVALACCRAVALARCGADCQCFRNNLSQQALFIFESGTDKVWLKG